MRFLKGGSMKKSAVIFLVFAFVQFITIPVFSTDAHLSDTDSITVQEFSLKTDYTKRANMRAVFFPVSGSLVEGPAFTQEAAEAVSPDEEIRALKKKRTGYLLGSIGLIAAGGLCIYQYTQVEPEKGNLAGDAGEDTGQRSSTSSGGQAVWIALGAVSIAVGAALIGQYSKTNKAVKAKEKELENLSQAQQRLAQVVSR
jgi:hypothetical protein